jgi:hypothetical protein
MDDSNSKSSFVSPSIVLNGTMEQVSDKGKTISTMGMIDFWPDK